MPSASIAKSDPIKRRVIFAGEPRCELLLGDCLQILPLVGKVDAVVTDPPYPGYEYAWPIVSPAELPLDSQHGFWFWPAAVEFPLLYTSRHIWSKSNVCVGDVEPYEAIYEVNGAIFHGVFRNAVINCEMNATINGDQYFAHPTQKPIKLMRRLVRRTQGTVLDPFMGSGTTGVACIKLGRQFIGIEISEDYFNIAVRRITEAREEVANRLPFEEPKRDEQLSLL